MITHKTMTVGAAPEPEIRVADGDADHGSGLPCTVRGSGKTAPALWCMALLCVFVAPKATEASGEFIWPTTGWLSGTDTYAGGGYHDGSADIAANSWSQIGAARGGSATAAYEGGGCGNYVMINHGSGYLTLYCHMVQWPSVSGGQSVGANQLIGYVGTTGNSTGPHLHFAIRHWGVRLAIPGIRWYQWVYRGQVIPGTYSPLSGTTTGTTGMVIPPANYVMYRLRLGIGLNIHNLPSWGSHIAGVLPSGTVVDVYGFVGGWLKIWYSNSWQYIANLGTAKVGLSVQATADLRVETGSGLAGWLPKNAIIHCWAWSNGWYRVWWNGAWRWIWFAYTRQA